MDSGLFSVLGILIAVAVFMVLIIKGVPVIVVAPFSACIVIAFSGGAFLQEMTGTFMSSMASSLQSNFPVFLLSSMFGKMMGDSGAAARIAYAIAGIAKRSEKNQKALGVFALIAIYTVLCYGGVSGFVIVFTVMPIARMFFEELDIPWHFFTCAGFGSGVLSLTILPGVPSVHNIMPCTYFGTTTMAAPFFSLIAAAIATVFCIIYVLISMKISNRKQEGFLPTGMEISAFIESKSVEKKTDKSLLLCLAPSIVLLIVMNGFQVHPVAALLAAMAVNYIIFFHEIGRPWKTLQEGGANAISAIINVSIVVGFGGVVTATQGYQTVLSALLGMSGPAALQIIIATNIASGISGSAMGGLNVTLNNLGEHFMSLGLNPQIVHRLTVMSCGGLDSLPTSGTSINTISVCRLTGHYAKAYRHTFFLTVLIPVIVCLISLALIPFGIV